MVVKSHPACSFPTPGHTMGRYSLTVKLPNMGMVIFATDAIFAS
jgi:glyoxylase-like metal-dependent hydrolase (beta-lactamase superfamily II)